MPTSTLRSSLVASLCLLVALGAAVAASPTPAAAQSAEAEVAVAQAILAYDAKNYSEATQRLQEALRLDPKNTEANYYMGLVLQAQGKPGDAAKSFERARQTEPNDLAILYQLGLAYYANKEYGKAEAPLERVFKADPKTDGVGYYLGFVKYKKGDYKGALETLRAGQSTDPDVQQLTKVYISLSLAQLGQPEQAKAEADQALKVPGATAATGVADRLRTSVVAKGQEERPFRAEVKVGFLYDTNPAVLPRPSRDGATEEVRQLRPVDSIGELWGLDVGYTFYKSGPYEAHGVAGIFRVNYNDEPHFNTINFLAGVGGSYTDALMGMPWRLNLDYTYDYTLIRSDAFLTRHTGTAVWSLVENSWNLSAFQIRYQDKSFAQIDNDVKQGLLGNGTTPGVKATQLTAEFRSAVNWLFGIVHVFRFENDKHFVRVGFQYDNEKADGRNYSYDGFRYLAGGQYTLPWYGIRTRYDFDLHQRYYRNKNSILNDDFVFQNFAFCHRCPYTREREDTEQNHTLGIEVPGPYNTTLTLQTIWTAASSNIDLFDFSRTVTSLTLSWRY